MKASKLRTLWILLLTVVYTIDTCGRAIFKCYFGKIKRDWVNKQTIVWVNKVLRSIRVDCKIINPHHTAPVPGKANIIMCNHSSLYDIPLSLKAFPNVSIRMLAKKELSKIPFMGGGMRAAEYPFVDRKNRTQAIKDMEALQDLLKSGIVLWIAPEGTRSKTGRLGSFKKGGFITAIQAKANIIPMGIRGAANILPAKSFNLNINQSAEVHIGEPIDAGKFSLENKEELMQLVRERMLTLVGQEDEPA